MIIEGTAEVDRIDDSGDVYAVMVWPSDPEPERGPVVGIEVRSVLGDKWWTEHEGEIPHNYGLPEIKWVAEQHPDEVRSLSGKRVRVTIEVLD